MTDVLLCGLWARLGAGKRAEAATRLPLLKAGVGEHQWRRGSWTRKGPKSVGSGAREALSNSDSIGPISPAPIKSFRTFGDRVSREDLGVGLIGEDCQL